LKKGDVILEVNGERVESPEDLMNEVSRSKDTLQFRIAPGFSQKNTIQTQQVSLIMVPVCSYQLFTNFNFVFIYL